MAATADDMAEAPARRSLMIPVLAGLVLAVIAGGASYWALTMGPLAPETAGTETEDEVHADTPAILPEVAFVPLEPLTISLGDDSLGRHLRVTAQLEVDPDHVSDVTHLLPRVLDVVNTYLRVVDLHDLNAPGTLSRIRVHLLHRVQIVTGDGWVTDFLITEFVVN